MRGFKSGANKFEKEFFTWRGLSYAWCYHYFQQQEEPSIALLPVRFLLVYMYVSRACLGKPRSFRVLHHQNVFKLIAAVSIFSSLLRLLSFSQAAARATLLKHANDQRCEKRHLFLSAFPMFVPSLSWQNDRFNA